MENTQRETSVPQEWYNENRERFNARTEVFEGDAPTQTGDFAEFNTKHHFYRKSATEVWCEHCPARWADLGEWTLKHGKIVKIRDRNV